MHDLVLKNFSIFKNETKIEIAPLNLLIGANGTGKSTLIKAINIIENQGQMFYAKKFDLGGFQNQANDVKKPIEISYRVANDLYRKIKIKGISDPSNSSFIVDYIDDYIIDFHNAEGISILSTKYASLTDVYKGIEIKLNIPLFYDILEQNGLNEFMNRLKTIGFADKIVIAKISSENFWFKGLFETWFFTDGIWEFMNKVSLDDFNIESSKLQGIIFQLFSPTFHEKKFHAFGQKLNEQEALPVKIFRISDYDQPKRVYEPTDNFSRSIEIYESNKAYVNSMFAMELVERWVEMFLGKEAKIEIKRLIPELSYFECKLNGRHLTEHGSGVVRIIQLIYNLSNYVTNRGLMDGETTEDLLNEFLERKLTISFPKRQILILEEPETNMHPDFQAKLAEMIFELSLVCEWHIIVETHSEYILRKFQFLIASKSKYTKQIQILNFGSEENSGKLKSIRINEYGGLSDNFYSGFFNLSEDLKLKLNSLNREKLN